MKSFFSALGLCSFLLVLCSFVVVQTADADANDVVGALLRLPAPPPPNPLVTGNTREYPPEFYSKEKPPPDDAPIHDILEYWMRQSGMHQDLRYTPEPSKRVLDRILNEIDKDPTKVSSYLNILGDSDRAAEMVRRIYRERKESEESSDEYYEGEEDSYMMEFWLKNNTDEFSAELAKEAENAGSQGEYVTNHDELLALTKVDWNRAAPIANRLYNDISQPNGKVLGTWALYRHAVRTDSFGDIERYRDELKRVVEDKKATPGMRDLAFDALVKEGDFQGRDEWYFGLLEDETLSDLKINNASYTGLTTLPLNQPPGKYRAKMLEILRSGNPSARNSAIRNLTLDMADPDPEVVRVLLPWLDDPNWANDVDRSRAKLVMGLAKLEMPESVPGLIKVLDESVEVQIPDYASSANSNSATNSVASTAANAAYAMMTARMMYPLRTSAVAALEKQASPQAVPALKRILSETDLYSQGLIIKAIFACGGYTIAEQVRGIEDLAVMIAAEKAASGESFERPHYYSIYSIDADVYPNRVSIILGMTVEQRKKAPDELVREALARVLYYERRDPAIAAEIRRIIGQWEGPAVNMLLLEDLRKGNADVETVTRLLAERKMLRENHSMDIYAARTGGPVAAAISACLLEQPGAYSEILRSNDNVLKSGLLACGRLIRAELPVATVAEMLSSSDKRLALAAELYLESEDSAEARGILLSKFPGQAKILGSLRAFVPPDPQFATSLPELFRSVNESAIFSEYYIAGEEWFELQERRLRQEVLNDAGLVGIYDFDGNTVRIFKDKVMYGYGSDPTRYLERPMTQSEFDYLRSYLVRNDVDQLRPFISCAGGCGSKQLLMLSRAGGRRVFTDGDPTHDFFRGLTEFFDSLKREPGILKYAAASSVPGLKVEFADENLVVDTVWAEGNDVRILLTNKAVVKQVAKDIQERVALEYENARSENRQSTVSYWELEQQRRWEGVSWHQLAGEGLGKKVAEPPDIEMMNDTGGGDIPAGEERWKAKAAGAEYRTDGETGLFRIRGGTAQKIADGYISKIVVTSNGRWAFATMYDSGVGLYRFDLTNGRRTPITNESVPVVTPVVYVPALNRVLASPFSSDEHYHAVHRQKDGDFYWIDPDTGAAAKVTASGGTTIDPLLQQTFRPLQKGPGANEFWAAVPDEEKDETQIGIFDAAKLVFTPKMSVPKIAFDSMNMWVNVPQNKVYFVYEGHLLSVPLTAEKRETPEN